MGRWREMRWRSFDSFRFVFPLLFAFTYDVWVF